MSMTESPVELPYKQKKPGSSKPQSLITLQNPGESEQTVQKRLAALGKAMAKRNGTKFFTSF